MSGEVALSKRARKKLAKENVSSSTPREESPASAKVATPPAVDDDGEFKLRDGANPFIDVVQKKIRNLNKRKVLSRLPPRLN